MNVNGEMLKLFVQPTFALVSVAVVAHPNRHGNVTSFNKFRSRFKRTNLCSFKFARNGSNGLGIQCAPETWQTLTNGGTDKITIQLVSSSKPDTKIYWVRPGWLLPRQSEGGGYVRGGGFANLIPDTWFLCGITGKHRGTGTVEITFPGGPDEPSAAEIIVMKRPDDLKTRTILGF